MQYTKIVIQTGNHVNVKRLIDCGATVDALDSEGFTPLMVAVRRGHLEAIRHLCVAGMLCVKLYLATVYIYLVGMWNRTINTGFTVL